MTGYNQVDLFNMGFELKTISSAGSLKIANNVTVGQNGHFKYFKLVSHAGMEKSKQLDTDACK